jgi:sugar phosphate permease
MIDRSCVTCLHSLFSENIPRLHITYFVADVFAMSPLLKALIPVLALSTHTFAFRIGLGCVPWFMVPEIIPKHAQYWANSLCNFYSYIALFAVLYSFVWGVDMFGFGPTFLFFSCTCTIGTLFIWLCVPETKQKSSEEIQDELKNGAKRAQYSKI